MLAAAMRRALAARPANAVALHYGDPAGEPRLRGALAAKIADFGIVASTAQIATTVGATQALDIVTRTLLRAGDSVLVDEPGWSVEYARLAALGMRVLPVPRGESGPDVAVMRRMIEAQRPAARPRLYVTVSVLHNPTGASLSLQSAHRVLQLASEFDLRIVEDDTYAHLAPAHAPRLAALDALERTIYVSGFSKILTPNWRVGFLAAPTALIDRFVDTKLLRTLTTPSAGELAMAHCLEQGWLRRHAERVRVRLAAARERTARLVDAHGCRFATPPHGLFGWVDTGVDTERLAQALIDDWLIAPGSIFHAEPRPTTLMRINFATSQDPRFWKALVAAGARAAPPSGRGEPSGSPALPSARAQRATRRRSARSASVPPRRAPGPRRRGRRSRAARRVPSAPPRAPRSAPAARRARAAPCSRAFLPGRRRAPARGLPARRRRAGTRRPSLAARLRSARRAADTPPRCLFQSS